MTSRTLSLSTAMTEIEYFLKFLRYLLINLISAWHMILCVFSSHVNMLYWRSIGASWVKWFETLTARIKKAIALIWRFVMNVFVLLLIDERISRGWPIYIISHSLFFTYKCQIFIISVLFSSTERFCDRKVFSVEVNKGVFLIQVNSKSIKFQML